MRPLDIIISSFNSGDHVSGNQEDTDDTERQDLLSEIQRLHGELRRRLLTLVEHQGVSEEFKSNFVVQEWIK